MSFFFNLLYFFYPETDEYSLRANAVLLLIILLYCINVLSFHLIWWYEGDVLVVIHIIWYDFVSTTWYASCFSIFIILFCTKIFCALLLNVLLFYMNKSLSAICFLSLTVFLYCYQTSLIINGTFTSNVSVVIVVVLQLMIIIDWLLFITYLCYVINNSNSALGFLSFFYSDIGNYPSEFSLLLALLLIIYFLITIPGFQLTWWYEAGVLQDVAYIWRDFVPGAWYEKCLKTFLMLFVTPLLVLFILQFIFFYFGNRLGLIYFVALTIFIFCSHAEQIVTIFFVNNFLVYFVLLLQVIIIINWVILIIFVYEIIKFCKTHNS